MLTRKQRDFIAAYIGGARGNASEAARAAGYAVPAQQGYENLRKPEIAAEIESQLADRTLSAPEVLFRLTEHARATIAHFVRQQGMELIADLTTESAQSNLHLIKKIRMRRRRGGRDGAEWEEIETEFELHDPQAALVQIGRYHKLFTDRREISGINGAPIVITNIEAVEPSARPDGDPA